MLSNEVLIRVKFSVDSSHFLALAARTAVGKRTTGARVMPSARRTLDTPAPICTEETNKHDATVDDHYQEKSQLTAKARHPRLVLATKQPSVVAMGT